ncbi:MAG TPA: FecR domain-containing protein [Puia sp.]|jgi:ferric-dicitrate binding protein FerR (iron transport regulator)|nr:FecR domain-containing protein [Puia sp.]
MEKRIAELFQKYLTNQCTSEEMEEFFHYIRESREDEALKKLLHETYQAIRNESGTYVDRTGELVVPDAEQAGDPALHPSPNAGRKGKLVKLLLAAAIVSGVSFGLVHLINPSAKGAAAAVKSALKKSSTERAEYKYILLPDSTQVWLNAGSALEYPEHFDLKKREVTLSGEAYFDVKHAAENPFLIHTGKILTTVLGTAFNINAYPERSNVTISVSRGKVRVTRGDQFVATLRKGQQVNVSEKDDHIAQKNIEVSSVAGWQKGNLEYDDEPMMDIIADLERVYSADIVISNSGIRELKISTSFHRELGVSHALEVLCKLTDSQLFQKDGTYIIQ